MVPVTTMFISKIDTIAEPIMRAIRETSHTA